MANMQATEQRISPGMHDDMPASDNEALRYLPSRELLILRQQTPRAYAATVARFLAKIRKTETCWLWTASAMDAYGHGQFTIRDADRKQHHLYAHRVAWVLSGRVIPHGLLLCHKCDVPPCVRPGHLFVGTQMDNIHDAMSKGRLIGRRRKVA